MERNVKSLAFKYIKLEMPVRNFRAIVEQTGGYNGPGWWYKLGSLNMEWDNLGSKCRQKRGPKFSDWFCLFSPPLYPPNPTVFYLLFLPTTALYCPSLHPAINTSQFTSPQFGHKKIVTNFSFSSEVLKSQVRNLIGLAGSGAYPNQLCQGVAT